MAVNITFSGEKAKRGERMTKGKGWETCGDERAEARFCRYASLETINLGDKRLAIFSVPK